MADVATKKKKLSTTWAGATKKYPERILRVSKPLRSFRPYSSRIWVLQNSWRVALVSDQPPNTSPVPVTGHPVAAQMPRPVEGPGLGQVIPRPQVI